MSDIVVESSRHGQSGKFQNELDSLQIVTPAIEIPYPFKANSMINHFIKFLFIAFVLTACSKKESANAQFAPSVAAALSDSRASAEPQRAAKRHLAYEHAITLDVEEANIVTAYTKIQTVCKEAADDACAILESRLQTGRQISADLKFRATPATLQKLLKSLGDQGKITNQFTTAEDLAGPIGDTAKKTEMLLDYRSKLEALRGQASSNIDALIKINKELAQVQSELEEMTGRNAHLMQRVSTEILSVRITSIQDTFFWKKISMSLVNFGANLSEGIASVITGIAFLAPWCLVLLALIWAIRKMWFRRKNKIS